ncbi:hypothetical protein BD289DRAFT_62425 [Coniella lustricola]|uniref:Uncharacterized protein n=1 Tax=Coniella lustricola TaxID=2025994 RepID=A0A2T3A0H9_9PEZI|nr:hypothetical protein BD289DRAFT_62425 [Coniella lustricola]
MDKDEAQSTDAMAMTSQGETIIHHSRGQAQDKSKGRSKSAIMLRSSPNSQRSNACRESTSLTTSSTKLSTPNKLLRVRKNRASPAVMRRSPLTRGTGGEEGGGCSPGKTPANSPAGWSGGDGGGSGGDREDEREVVSIWPPPPPVECALVRKAKE